MGGLQPSKEEIEKMLDLTDECKDFEGMTYQDGVKYTLEWVLGYSIEPPFSDEDKE